MHYHDKTYNCLHFACDFYERLTGNDPRLFVDGLLTGKDDRRVNPSALSAFCPTDTPTDGTWAVMHGAAVHIGIYQDGLIHHLTESGQHATPPHIAQLQHGRIIYYELDCNRHQ